LDQHFDRIELLVNEMQRFVPATIVGAAEFRGDLAGLLVVTIAASYESCVKEVMIMHAGRHHAAFGNFATNNYKKINSKISIQDLHGYASNFDENIARRFKEILNTRKRKIDLRIGKNIESCYKQILSWRHNFAHARIRNTTIEEALLTHHLAKRVLYAFDEAFNGASS